VTGPTPHISSTGKSWRKASSAAGFTTISPSGLATCEAILARCLVRATPTEIGSPSSIAQAAALIEVLAVRRPFELGAAWDDAWDSGPRWREKLKSGRQRLSARVNELLSEALGRSERL
jgi:hypothetical protein